MPQVVLRDTLSPAERFWLAPKGFISNEGLVVIPCDRAEIAEAGMLRLQYKSSDERLVALDLPLQLVLAILDFPQDRQPPGFGSPTPSAQADPASQGLPSSAGTSPAAPDR